MIQGKIRSNKSKIMNGKISQKIQLNQNPFEFDSLNKFDIYILNSLVFFANLIFQGLFYFEINSIKPKSQDKHKGDMTFKIKTDCKRMQID